MESIKKFLEKGNGVYKEGNKIIRIEDFNPDSHGNIQQYEIVDGTNYGSYQQGGLYPNQDQFDFFIDFYNQKEKQNDLTQEAYENYYSQKNQMMESQWKQKQSSGIQGALSGALGVAGTFLGKFQGGGRLIERVIEGRDGKEMIVYRKKSNKYVPGINEDSTKINPHHGEKMRDTSNKSKSKDRFRELQEGGDYNPKVDLYSPEYDPNEFLGVVENEISQAQIEDKELSTIEQWLFQDEPDYFQEELNLNYFNPDSNGSNGSNSTGVVDKIMQMESGGNPEVVNPTTNATGLFQFVPKYWAGQIKSFMSLPQTFTQDQVMDAFKKNPQVQKEFMNHVVNDIYMPEVEKLRPLARKYGFNDDQIIRLLHYRGIDDATKRLQTGNFTVSESEVKKYKNPQILDYLNK